MRILYYNNCWFTNVGEAFIDLGAMTLIRKIFPKSQIACISDMSDYYCNNVKKHKYMFSSPLQKTANIYEFLSAEYIILAGMFGTLSYLNSPSRSIIDRLVQNGSKVIFLGLGNEKYQEDEVSSFSRYLDKLNPLLIMTRDNKTFDFYKNVANCIKGIDCAFWVKDIFDPSGFSKNIYDIAAFNRTREPDIFQDWDCEIIHPWHMQYSYTSKNAKPNTLLSDSPFDYLTAYANARNVYTDLVHATIVSLMYGTPVKYWYFDERCRAFEAINNIETDNNRFMTVNSQLLDLQKEFIVGEIIAQLFPHSPNIIR